MPSRRNADFATRLLDWFDRHGRTGLPWQRDPSPYRVWLSEIMLQQTQVTTAIPYFERFTERYPTLAALAEAELDEVLTLWSGLGYYARARNLHRAAAQIVADHGGALPQTQQALEQLPGIGRSTAGAIRALAFGQRAAILDGNVRRVLARYHGIEGWPGHRAVEQELWDWAERHLPDARIGDYTQAMMDLGALLCLRRRPDCPNCPQRVDCIARRDGSQERLPTPKPARSLPTRSTHMLLWLTPNRELLLERRPPSGIWGGLLSPPQLEATADLPRFLHDWGVDFEAQPTARESSSRATTALYGLNPTTVSIAPLPQFRHTFSHFHLEVTPLLLRANAPNRIGEAERWLWYKLGAKRPPLPAPIQRLLNQLEEQQHDDENGPLRKTG